MSNENISHSASEQSAQQYLQGQLDQARRSLKRTRTVSIVVALFVLGYMSFVTTSIREKLAPESAADLAVGILTDQVKEKGDILSSRLRAEVPRLVRQLPEYALNQLPVFRADLEEEFERDFAHYCRETSQAFETRLDHFLDEHQKAIKEFINNAQDEKTVKLLGEDLQKEVLAYLRDKSEGESIKEKLDEALATLNRAANHLERLAKATNLTDEEKRTRRAIAVLLKKMDWDQIQKQRENLEKLENKKPKPAAGNKASATTKQN